MNSSVKNIILALFFGFYSILIFAEQDKTCCPSWKSDPSGRISYLEQGFRDTPREAPNKIMVKKPRPSVVKIEISDAASLRTEILSDQRQFGYRWLPEGDRFESQWRHARHKPRDPPGIYFSQP